MKTKITELLGIEYPIVQGAMAWIAGAPSGCCGFQAGGLGHESRGGRGSGRDYIREVDPSKARAITRQAVGGL